MEKGKGQYRVTVTLVAEVFAISVDEARDKIESCLHLDLSPPLMVQISSDVKLIEGETNLNEGR